ncbi:unnamed protein product [Ectocarpus sp. 12 AP-2014]
MSAMFAALCVPTLPWSLVDVYSALSLSLSLSLSPLPRSISIRRHRSHQIWAESPPFTTRFVLSRHSIHSETPLHKVLDSVTKPATPTFESQLYITSSETCTPEFAGLNSLAKRREKFHSLRRAFQRNHFLTHPQYQHPTSTRMHAFDAEVVRVRTEIHGKQGPHAYVLIHPNRCWIFTCRL